MTKRRRPPDSVLFPAGTFADVCCPDCGTSDVEIASLFGSTTSEVLFQCLQCRSFFNWIKWCHQLPPIPARRDGNTPNS